MSKSATLLFITVLMLSSFIMVGCAFAESMPKPYIPEFTVKVRDHSYYVPPTYRTDPYTGTNELIREGYVAQNGTIEVSIKPQLFTQYTDAEGNTIRLYFRIAYKGHSALGWNYYPPNDGFSGNYSQYFSASDSGSTNTLFGFGEYEFGGEDKTIYTPPSLGEISAGGKIDFKVEAFIGYYKTLQYIGISGLTYYNVYTGKPSGWSNTQTITIAESQTPISPSPTFTPYKEPHLTEQEAIIGVAVTVAVLAAGLGLLLYLVKRK